MFILKGLRPAAICSVAAGMLAACGGQQTTQSGAGLLPSPLGRLSPSRSTESGRLQRLIPEGKASKSITFTIKSAGGAFTIPSYGGFSGSGSYNPNNAPQGAQLTLTNSGTHNVLGAPTPSYGTPILYLEASLKGASSVTFKSGANTVTIVSKSLENGTTYDIVSYAGSGQVQSYSAGTAKKGQLTFQTPLSALSLYSGTPITVELVVPASQSLLVPCQDCGSSDGAVEFYNGNAPGGVTNSLGAHYAASVALDDVNNLYVGGEASSGSEYISEYYNAGGSFTYTNNLPSEDVSVPGIGPLAGSSPAFDAVTGVGTNYGYEYLTFPQQGLNQSSGYDDPNLGLMYGIAVDALSNAYVSGQNYSGGYEVDFLETNVGAFNLGLQLSGPPYGLALDSQGNLLVAEFTGVAVFPPGQTAPSRIYDAHKGSFSVAFGNGGDWLYVGNVKTPSYSVEVNAYPQGKTLWTDSLPPGTGRQIAIEPRLPLFNPDFYRRMHPRFKYWTDFVRGRVEGPDRSTGR